MVKYVQPPSKEKTINLCSCVSLLASYRFSYMFGPLLTSREEAGCVFCGQREEHGFFDPVFLKISLVARQKLVTFYFSSNILACKMLTQNAEGVMPCHSLLADEEIHVPSHKPRLCYLITQLQEQPVGFSHDSAPVRFCVC